MIEGGGANPNQMETREQILHTGYNPPRLVDKIVPTLEATIQAVGGPGQAHPKAIGSNPWIAGSLTIGTNKYWNITHVELMAGSPRTWFVLRHNHAGNLAGSTPTNRPGGTIDAWYAAARGDMVRVGDAQNPLRSIPPGTVSVYVFGERINAGSTGNTNIYRGLGRAGSFQTGVKLKGYVR